MCLQCGRRNLYVTSLTLQPISVTRNICKTILISTTKFLSKLLLTSFPTIMTGVSFSSNAKWVHKSPTKDGECPVLQIAINNTKTLNLLHQCKVFFWKRKQNSQIANEDDECPALRKSTKSYHQIFHCFDRTQAPFLSLTHTDIQ